MLWGTLGCISHIFSNKAFCSPCYQRSLWESRRKLKLPALTGTSSECKGAILQREMIHAGFKIGFIKLVDFYVHFFYFSLWKSCSWDLRIITNIYGPECIELTQRQCRNLLAKCVLSSSPQSFSHQRLASWKIISIDQGREEWFGNDLRTFHLLCTLFLLLLHCNI